MSVELTEEARAELQARLRQVMIYDMTQSIVAGAIILSTLLMFSMRIPVSEAQMGAFWFVLGFFFRNASERGVPLRRRAMDATLAGLMVATLAGLAWIVQHPTAIGGFPL